MKKLVVLISGNGSNLQSILDACESGRINGSVAAVFSNKASAYGLTRAQQASVPAHALSAQDFADRDAFDRQLMQQIDAYAPDLVVYFSAPLYLERTGAPVNGNGHVEE